jgi:hypothetical protein
MTLYLLIGMLIIITVLYLAYRKWIGSSVPRQKKKRSERHYTFKI